MAKLIEARNVACRKDKEHTIFSQLNFDVYERDVIVLQGKSGAGYINFLFLLYFVWRLNLCIMAQENYTFKVHRPSERL
jgi:ABC-type transport system involved in cytochrome c biogenesis ATPase subunit